eukprot:GILK01005292.1.p1 GENE.GILK01005292.1~~GILK01005292.1.p1  ORF type:complete len:408 (+),score=52.77 GILK01005292.1:54-1277(+)
MEGFPLVRASKATLRTTNPIRQIVDKIKKPDNSDKPFLALNIGDPALYGNLDTPDFARNALASAILKGRSNGYTPSTGTLEARQAVVRMAASAACEYTVDDIMLTSGCSMALYMAICVLAEEGENILVPRPAFPLYQSICEHYGIETRHYNLLPESNWEADLQSMESEINEKTRAILVNNPSNPCGAVYSKTHLEAIVQLAERYRLPLISDEVYADMVFEGHEFIPLAAVSKNVPVLTCGGLAKQFLAPGWRMGWILICDRTQACKQVREGLVRLSQVLLHPNSVVQAALPEIQQNMPPTYFKDLCKTLQANGDYAMARLSSIHGLRVVPMQGAMYLMVGMDPDAFSDIENDVELTQKLLTEESVGILPGVAFGAPNFFRLVICAPVEIMKTAFDRIAEFCLRHRKI